MKEAGGRGGSGGQESVRGGVGAKSAPAAQMKHVMAPGCWTAELRCTLHTPHCPGEAAGLTRRGFSVFFML